MYSKALTAATFLSLALFNNVAAQDIESNDIPNQCNLVCNSLVTASEDCDRYANSDDNNQYHNCMCTGDNSQNVVQLCEACVYEARVASGNDASDARDNDVHELLTICGFATTSYDLSGSATPTSPMMGNTHASKGSLSVTSSTGLASSVSSISASLTSASGALSTATGSAASSISSQISQLSSSLTSATAAASQTANVGAVNRDDAKIGGAAFAGALAIFAAALA